MPKTSVGKWSLWLIVAMFVLYLLAILSTNLLYPSVPSGNTLLEDMARRPLLSLAMLAGVGSGIAAFITGIIALVKQKERAPLVYLATIIGLLLLLFLSGEGLFPH